MSRRATAMTRALSHMLFPLMRVDPGAEVRAGVVQLVEHRRRHARLAAFAAVRESRPETFKPCQSQNPCAADESMRGAAHVPGVKVVRMRGEAFDRLLGAREVFAYELEGDLRPDVGLQQIKSGHHGIVRGL